MHYSLKRATILNLISYFYLLVLSLITTPGLIKYLGLTQFGSYVLSMGILALVTSLDLGLSRSVVYFLASSKINNQKKAYATASLTIHTLLAVIYFLLLLILFSRELAILTFATYLLAHSQTLPESEGRFGLVNIRLFVVGSTNTLGALYLAKVGFGVEGILNSLTLATILTIIINTCLAPNTYQKLDWTALKKIIGYGLKLQLTKLVGSIQSQYPKFLLASSSLGLAVYSLSSNLVSKLVGIVTQFAIAIFPATSRSNDLSLKKIYLQTQFFLVICGLGTVYLYQLYGLNVLSWWLKDHELANSLHTFLITYRYYALLLALTPLASTILESKGLAGRNSFYGLVALLIELGFVYIYYPQLGYQAVAYASLASLIIMVPILLFTTQKTLFADDKIIPKKLSA